MTSWLPYIKTSMQLSLSSVHQPGFTLSRGVSLSSTLSSKHPCGESKDECNYVSLVGLKKKKNATFNVGFKKILAFILPSTNQYSATIAVYSILLKSKTAEMHWARCRAKSLPVRCHKAMLVQNSDSVPITGCSDLCSAQLALVGKHGWKNRLIIWKDSL